MNVQPKQDSDDCTMTVPAAGAHGRRIPGGPRAYSTWSLELQPWPVELEVGPWRP